VDDQFLGNHPGAVRVGWPQELALHNVARGLRSRAAGPSIGCAVEPRALPPVGILARQMTRGLVGSCDCLADAVGGHEQPLFVFGAGREVLKLLRVQLPAERSRLREETLHPVARLARPFRIQVLKSAVGLHAHHLESSGDPGGTKWVPQGCFVGILRLRVRYTAGGGS
jgi:hypothetical protein